MSVEIRKPNINAKDVVGQTAQIRAYLYELTNQLNWAMNALSGEIAEIVINETKNEGSQEKTDQEKLDTFNSLKELIIKSADIVEAFEKKMTLDFESKFWAAANVTYEDKNGEQKIVETDQEYLQYMKNTLGISSGGVTQTFKNIQMIRQKLLDYMVLDIDAYIKTGLLEEGTSENEGIYGVEVGQTTELNGNTIYRRFARFTSDKLSFYDSNGNEIGYYAGNKFYITKGEITEEFIFGKFLLDAKDGFRIYW